MVAQKRGGRKWVKVADVDQQHVSEAELEKAWNSIFAGHPTESNLNRLR